MHYLPSTRRPPAGLRSPFRFAGAGRQGFSLVEILIVIIILGLMSSLAVVSWQSLVPNQRFNSEVRKLSDVLNGTRSDAIARSRDFYVLYDLENDAYRVRTPFRQGGGFALHDDDDFLFVNERDLTEAGIAITEVRVEDETYTEGDVWIRFDPRGSSAGHSIVLYQEMFNRYFTIEVLPLTGEIRFHDGHFEREPVDEGDFR